MLPRASFAATHAHALDRALQCSIISRIPEVAPGETRPGSRNPPSHDPTYCRLGWTSMSERMLALCLCACFCFLLVRVRACACAVRLCASTNARVHLHAERNPMAYVACDQLHTTYTHACTHTHSKARWAVGCMGAKEAIPGALRGAVDCMGARAGTAGISGNMLAAVFTQHSAVIVRVSMICTAGDLFLKSRRPGLLAPTSHQRFR